MEELGERGAAGELCLRHPADVSAAQRRHRQLIHQPAAALRGRRQRLVTSKLTPPEGNWFALLSLRRMSVSPVSHPPPDAALAGVQGSPPAPGCLQDAGKESHAADLGSRSHRRLPTVETAHNRREYKAGKRGGCSQLWGISLTPPRRGPVSHGHSQFSTGNWRVTHAFICPRKSLGTWRHSLSPG